MPLGIKREWYVFITYAPMQAPTIKLVDYLIDFDVSQIQQQIYNG
jgi:hypothetical protein